MKNIKSLINTSSNISKIILILGLILYKLLLDYIYYKYVTIRWEYQGFNHDYNYQKYVTAWIVFVFFIPSLVHFFNNFKSSSVSMISYIVIFFIPFLSVYAISNFSQSFFIYTIAFWIIMTVLLWRDKYISIKFSRKNKKVFYWFLIIPIVLNVFLTIYYNGFQLKFDISDVYDIRLAVRDMDLPGFYGYLKPMAKTFTLIGMVMAINKKQWYLLALLTLCQLMNFAFGALKSDFFYIFIAYAVGFGWKNKYKHWIVYSLVFLAAVSVYEISTYGLSLTSDIVIRRMLFMPSEISFKYYDFFSDHELAYLRNSIAGRLGFDSPYSQDIARIIGSEVYGSTVMNANTGICGDDYAQLGWAGLFFYPWFRVCLMKIMDACVVGINPKIVVFISISFALNFISGSLFSVLLTGAFIATVYLFYLWPREKEDIVSSD